AFDAALTEWYEERDEAEKKAGEINQMLRTGLKELGIQILSPEHATPYILSVVAPLPSEVFTRMLMDKGFCVSSGSACSNNAKGKAEGVLEAMGIQNQIARKAIRISLSKDTTMEEGRLLLQAFKELING
ncbi:MAG: cysteine desulfurase, partial [Spirochaetales bacterium]|nr:cysteine desulfurase [Candidatus Physcosoma equi]